jgi:hypothetical protein
MALPTGHGRRLAPNPAAIKAKCAASFVVIDAK